VKFLHAADLHLDSPLRGLERYEGAPVEQLRGASRRAMENLVDLCLAEAVDFVLLAGDLYDGDWKDYSTALFFAAQVSRLRQAEIPVLWVRGNHDAASRMTKHLRLPDNSVEFPSSQPTTRVLDELGVAVHGQSFATAAVQDDLAVTYPEPVAGAFNVGLLHTSVTGRPGHAPYAPCRLETLVGKGYDYWALGHVHAREVLCEQPLVLFPGNLQGRHARETGAKGATLVEVEGGKPVAVHRTLDVVRWARIEVDASECASADDVVDVARAGLEDELGAAGGRSLAARVVVRGGSAAHAELHNQPERWRNAIRAAATDVEPEGIWIERVQLATDPPVDTATIAAREDAVGALLRSLHQVRDDPARVEAMVASLAELRAKLPPELRTEPNDLTGRDAVLAAVEDVERLLFSRLLDDEAHE